MIVSHTRRVLFVHVQKTGGSTVEGLLLRDLEGAERVSGLPGGRHSTLRQVGATYPEVLDYWSFGFVRNPWARLYSWHSMVLRRGEAAAERRGQMAERVERSRFWGPVLARYPSFESFVMEAPDEFGRLRRPQVDYLRSRQHRVDFIGRTESFDDDVRQAFTHLGLPVPESVPHTNAGPSTGYREHYTPAMRDRVADLFAADLDEFGYEF